MYIIREHKSAFSVVPAKNSEKSAEAAKILADYIFKVTGCGLPTAEKVCEKCRVNKIVLDTVPFELPLEGADGLGDEGFVIAEKDGTVYLYAASDVSLLYAVYDFLEKYFGCLWLTSQDDYIPHKCSVEIPDGTFDKQLPAMNFREVYYRDAWDPDFAVKQKLNGHKSYVDENGKVVEWHDKWGFWCHSFGRLIPPAEYFESHPEYFALVDGKRINNGQLCCTNDEMIEEAIKNLRKHMEEKPDAKYWSVSQNDTTGFCTCEKCRKLDEEAGSQIGSIMYFVNKVAEAFPDKIISTLSYWYSRTAPKKIEMRDNVHIMLCDIECERSKPMPQNPENESFVKDIAVWHKYCGNVFLWDYDIQFSNLIAPFPNLRVLAPNMQFFYENSVRSIFNQGNRDKRGDMWALRTYLLAKLSWDPYCDIEKHRKQFLEAYYGKAAKFIDLYLNFMENELKKSGQFLGIFGQPQDEKFLNKFNVPLYMSILSKARDAVRGNDEKVLRVEEVMLGVVYVILKAKLYVTKEEKENHMNFFRRVADAIGLEKVEEWHETVDMFLDTVGKQD